MGLLDGVLSQLGGNADITSIGERVGLSTDQVESAITALARAHPQPGDTVQTAAQNTGLAPEALQQIVGHLGGEGGLGRFANLLGGTGQDGR